jgi:hypothetical protein
MLPLVHGRDPASGVGVAAVQPGGGIGGVCGWQLLHPALVNVHRPRSSSVERATALAGALWPSPACVGAADIGGAAVCAVPVPRGEGRGWAGARGGRAHKGVIPGHITQYHHLSADIPTHLRLRSSPRISRLSGCCHG